LEKRSIEEEEKTMDNTIVWADIPVTDLDRAMAFYGAVLQRPFAKVEGMDGVALEAPPENAPPPDMSAGTFPVSFDLALTQVTKPSTDGCTIYLNSYGDPEGMLQRAEAAGGTILQAASYMGEMVGTIGFFEDTEGNRVGVHKPPQM
jgi:predicted enzyme related to lactoylglutathione lyase